MKWGRPPTALASHVILLPRLLPEGAEAPPRGSMDNNITWNGLPPSHAFLTRLLAFHVIFLARLLPEGAEAPPGGSLDRNLT